MKYQVLFLISSTLFLGASDTIYTESDIGRTVTWIYQNPSDLHGGISPGDTRVTTHIDPANEGRTISHDLGKFHRDYEGITWEFSTDPEPDPEPPAPPSHDRSITETRYFGVLETFASTGYFNVGEFRFVASVTTTASWDGFEGSNSAAHINIDSIELAGNNIPTGHFAVGIDTWRFSQIVEYETLENENPMVEKTSNFYGTSEPSDSMGHTRTITLRYGVVFNRVKYNGESMPPYTFYFDIPLTIESTYE